MTDDDALHDLLTHALATDAVRSRAGRGALRELAAEDATITGLLVDLADDRRRVRLVVGGTPVSGVLVRVWSEGALLLGPGHRTLVRIAAIELVASPDGVGLDGDERTTTTRSWLALLHEHLERGDVAELVANGTRLRGTVSSIGLEVVAMATPEGSTNYARTDCIDVVVVADPSSR